MKNKEHRSGLEDAVASEMTSKGVDYRYEQDSIYYVKPKARYLTDFVLPNGIIIETKGRFDSADRAKHLMIKKQHPDLDVRFLFSNPASFIAAQKHKQFVAWLKGEHNITRLTKAVKEKYKPIWLETLDNPPSQTTYASWCEKHGFDYAAAKDGVPVAWLADPVSIKRIKALEKAGLK